MRRFVTAIFILGLSACSEQTDNREESSTTFKAAALPDFTTFTNVQKKKQAFFDYLLPMIREANRRVKQERELVKKWRREGSLSEEEQQQLQELISKYRVKAETEAGQQEVLLNRVNAIPASLVLAQAANESAWGTSRFARQGNNLFGQWCFSKGCGLVPAARNDGAIHEVRSFSSPMESIESYILNLNRHNKYRQLRLIRSKQIEEKGWASGTALAAGLIGYSERGQAYVNEIRHMIDYNGLEQYDRPQSDPQTPGEERAE